MQGDLRHLQLPLAWRNMRSCKCIKAEILVGPASTTNHNEKIVLVWSTSSESMITSHPSKVFRAGHRMRNKPFILRG